MSSRNPLYYGAIVALIKNEHWEYLCNKRKNTNFYDGYYGFPTGHIETWEVPSVAASREIMEEFGIIVQPENMWCIHVSHRQDPDRTTILFWFDVMSYSGTPQNMESDKSEWIFWIDPNQESQLQYKETFEEIQKKANYSEIQF